MKKKSPEGRIWHATKPDSDNAAKAILDALSKIFMVGLYPPIQ